MTDGTNLTKRGRCTFCSRMVGRQWPLMPYCSRQYTPAIAAILQQTQARCSRPEDVRIRGGMTRSPCRSEQSLLTECDKSSAGDRWQWRAGTGSEPGLSHETDPRMGHYWPVSGGSIASGSTAQKSRHPPLCGRRCPLSDLCDLLPLAPLLFPLTTRLSLPSTQTRRQADDTISLASI